MAENARDTPMLEPGGHEESFRLLVESVRDYAIFHLDADGYIASWNLGAERINGYRSHEIIGKHFSIFYPPDDVATGKCDMELSVAHAEGKYDEEGWRVRKDGTLFWSHVVITALLDASGALIGYAKVTRDMTNRRRQEEALRAARDAAERANEHKTEFLSRVSHELRTPLTVILGFAELLQMQDPHPEQERKLAAIHNASSHLLALINDVLDIARIERGEQDLDVVPVGARGVLEEAVELLSPLALDKQIVVEVNGENAAVLADPQRLHQIILNLISNAIKYNHAKGYVRCSVRVARDRVFFEVEDSGMGIHADKISALFQAFNRLGAESLGIEGTGLGLALSQRLAEAMGGKIAARSEPGVGSTFTLTLPAVSGQDRGRVVALPSAGQPAHIAEEIRLLYIEDNLANIELVDEVLKFRPHVRLVTALQGQMGLDIVRQHSPQAILLDLHLPDMTGQEVLENLKRDPDTADIPVVILTADALASQRKALLAAGAHSFMTKPVGVQELLAIVDQITVARVIPLQES